MYLHCNYSVFSVFSVYLHCNYSVFSVFSVHLHCIYSVFTVYTVYSQCIYSVQKVDAIEHFFIYTEGAVLLASSTGGLVGLAPNQGVSAVGKGMHSGKFSSTDGTLTKFP